MDSVVLSVYNKRMCFLKELKFEEPTPKQKLGMTFTAYANGFYALVPAAFGRYSSIFIGFLFL